MALRPYHCALTPAALSLSLSRDYPSPYRSYPYNLRSWSPLSRRRSRSRSRHRRRSRSRDGREGSVECLRDKRIERRGDLGWSLDYATAWLYYRLKGNRTEVADAIDRVRENPEDVARITPFLIFDYLDKAIFGGKLKGMVCLRWRPEASRSPGTTSAPGVVENIPRICVTLNTWPFEDDCGLIDDLLDALIHQMIHAYFLVACGAQEKGAKQDGRLMDGVHFCVIMKVIRHITGLCRKGDLDLVYYAAQRTRLGDPLRRPRSQRYDAFDSRGSPAGPAITDGQSHCGHDNSGVRPEHINNWPIQSCASALKLQLEERGTTVHDLNKDNKIVAIDRLKAPPSATYIELLWKDERDDLKRVMVKREKSLKHASIRRIIDNKNGKMELVVPACSFDTFKLLWDFLNLEGTWKSPEEIMAETSSQVPAGPPVILDGASPLPSSAGAIAHLKLFEVAESMRLDELQEYCLKRLFGMPFTTDNPIEILKELYSDKTDKGPSNAELHKWARGFLTRLDDGTFERSRLGGYSHWGVSNYEKLAQWYLEPFTALYHRNAALKEDVHSAYAVLSSSVWQANRWPESTPVVTPIPSRTTVISDQYTRPARLVAPRSSSLLDWNGVAAVPALSPSAYDDLALPYRPRRLFDWQRRSAPLPLSLRSSHFAPRLYDEDYIY